MPRSIPRCSYVLRVYIYIYHQLPNPTNFSGLNANLVFTRDVGEKPGFFRKITGSEEKPGFFPKSGKCAIGTWLERSFGGNYGEKYI